jgi:hypothetical protein
MSSLLTVSPNNLPFLFLAITDPSLGADYRTTTLKTADALEETPARAQMGCGLGVAMQDFIKNFMRAEDGSWLCVAPADLRLAQGRVQVTPGSRFLPGTKFMNVDLAALLEEEYRRSDRPT